MSTCIASLFLFRSCSPKRTKDLQIMRIEELKWAFVYSSTYRSVRRQCAAVKTCLAVIRVPPHLNGVGDKSSSYPISATHGQAPILLTSPPTIFLKELLLLPQPSANVGKLLGIFPSGFVVLGLEVGSCDCVGQHTLACSPPHIPFDALRNSASCWSFGLANKRSNKTGQFLIFIQVP